MKIFLLGTRMFMYYETIDSFDPAVDFPRHLTMSPRAVEWGQVRREQATRPAAPHSGRRALQPAAATVMPRGTHPPTPPDISSSMHPADYEQLSGARA